LIKTQAHREYFTHIHSCPPHGLPSCLYSQTTFETFDRETRDDARREESRELRERAHEVTAEDTELAISKSLSNTSVIGTEGMFHLFNYPLKEHYPTHRGAI
jgi:hypothetical protein